MLVSEKKSLDFNGIGVFKKMKDGVLVLIKRNKIGWPILRLIVVLVTCIPQLQAAELLYDSFESPNIAPPFSNGAPPGWTGVGTSGLADVATIEIRSSQPTWLQISEVVATETGSGSDLALSSAGATASGSGNYTAASNPDKTIDGVGPSGYPNIYHSDSTSAAEFLRITLATPSQLDSLTIMGRTNCCSDRDVFDLYLYDTNGVLLFSGTNYSADNGSNSVTVSFPASGSNSSGVLDEASGLLSTPYGEQVVWVNSGSLATTNSNLSAVLTAGNTYTLSFNVAKRTDLGGNYKVELLAGSTVLGSATGTPSLNDFSESDEIIFVAAAGHANLGQTLQIRLSTNGTAQPQFDNVRLIADDGLFSVAIEGVSQDYTVSPYGGGQDQAGTVEVRDAGLSLFLEGNRWQKIDFPYTVTANTVIEFDFQSTVEGEVQGLGFDNNLGISANRSFRVYGTQNWGISDFATYTGSGATHFSIPVGQYYTGAFNYLFFMNDDDSNPTGNSLYSNINVYEGGLPTVNAAASSCLADNLIIVEFDSDANASAMTNISSYSLDNGASVTAVTKQDDRTAILTVDNLDPATAYSLTVGSQTIATSTSGLLGRYFDQRNGSGTKVDYTTGLFTGNEFLRSDGQINFSWGSGAPSIFPNISGNEDRFSVRWQGFIVPDQAGNYEFRMRSDDGVRLDFDGSEIINDWSLHGPRYSSVSAPRTLNAGQAYTMQMEFFEHTGGAVAELEWQRDGSGWQNVPSANLSSCATTGSGLTPIIEYRFDEESWNGSANEVIDSSGNMNNGNTVGGITTTSGKICNAANIPANSSPSIVQAVDTGIDLDTIIGSRGTISLWYQGNNAWNSGSDKRLFDATDGDKYFAAEIGADGRVKFWFEDGNDGDYQKTTVTSFAVGAGVWKHLTFVWDVASLTAKIFVDGVEQSVSGGTGGNAVFSGLDTLYFGDNRDASYFTGQSSADGLIDEALVFDSVLTTAQIQTIFTNQDAGNNYDGSVRSCPATTCGDATLSSVGIKIDGGGSDRRINNTTEALAIHAAWLAAGSPASGLIDGGTYNVAASGTSTVDRIDFGGSGHDFPGTLPYPGVGAGVSGSDFLVYTSGTLGLPAGDYSIFVESDDGFSFIMNTLSGDTVSFSKFGSSSSGASNELRFENPTGNSNTGGSFTLTQDSVFDIAAIFFERGGGDYLEISIANDIRTNSAPSGYEILREGALSGKVALGQCLSPSGPDHYAISHSSPGLSCEGSQITVSAHDATHNPFTVASDTALTVSTTPAVSSIISNPVTMQAGTSSATFFLNQTSVLTNIDIDVTDGSATDLDDGSSEDPAIDFLDTAFRFYTNGSSSTNIGTQIAGKPSNISPGAQSLSLRAVRANTDTGACEAALQGTTSVNFAYECNNPTSCTASNLLTLTGASTASISRNNNATVSKTYAPVNMTFDSNGEAPFSFNFADAGQITLYAEKTVAANSPEPAFTLSGNSNAFVTRPFGFNLDFNDANAFALDQNGSAFKTAGSDFTMQVTAVNWQAGDDTDNDGVPDSGADLSAGNATAFNFGQEISANPLAIDHALALPSPATGVSGTFSAAPLTVGGAGSFTNGSASTTINWDEVGIIDIQAAFDNYLADPAADITTTVENVGRFYPASFDVAITDASFAPVCSSVFTYLDQNFQFDTAPEVTITALNVMGNVTQNYEGDFWKLGAALQEQSTCSAIGTTKGFCYTDNVSGLASLWRPNSAQNYGADLSDINGEVTLTLHNQSFDLFQYQRPVGTNIPPFDADVQLMIELRDDDGVTGSQTLANIGFTGDLDSGNKNASNERFLRQGRWKMENAFGPETQQLKMKAYAQYYSASNRFERNADDNCTALSSTEITLTPTGTGASSFDDIAVGGGSSSFTLNSPLSGVESENFFFSAPLTGNIGTIDVDVNLDTLPWLKFDWDNDNNLDNHPSVEATFGQYRGHDRIIYWREIAN